MKIYNVGINNTIQLQVIVGTVGTAQSVILQRWSGGPKRTIGFSDPDDGNFPETNIGTSASLVNSFIEIRTAITFGPEVNNIPLAIKGISINYIVNGGPTGRQTFQPDLAQAMTALPDGITFLIINQITLNL